MHMTVCSGDSVLLASAPADDESVVVKVRWRRR